jgi:hypothetical protein
MRSAHQLRPFQQRKRWQRLSTTCPRMPADGFVHAARSQDQPVIDYSFRIIKAQERSVAAAKGYAGRAPLTPMESMLGREKGTIGPAA